MWCYWTNSFELDGSKYPKYDLAFAPTLVIPFWKTEEKCQHREGHSFIILCLYYISKWIWPFWLFWAIIASLTSRFDINTNCDASKQKQMIWLSVDCCCCVLYCPKHFKREKVWLIRLFFFTEEQAWRQASLH